jgi:hypothetical protein
MDAPHPTTPADDEPRGLLARLRRRPMLLWDLFMVYLAVLNVALILFDWTWPWLLPFWRRRWPWVVEHYDPERFWLVDLPFLLFFAAELFVRWGRAVRHGTYPRWWVFAVVHWYDVLGIVPFHQFRVFRLFRIVSIYARLHRSEMTSVGDDVVSRTVRRFADVISEEITDRVALRILGLVELEVRAGALSRLTRGALLPRRDEVREQIVDRLADVLADPVLHERAGVFLRANLDRAAVSSPALARLPLPKVVLAPLVKTVGELVYDAFVETLTATVRSTDGRRALDDWVEEVMEVFAGQLGRGEIEVLVEQTVIDLLAEMRRAVAEKRWTGGLAPPPAAGGARPPR